MGWLEDAVEGVKKATQIVETVGDFGEAVGSAVDAVPSPGGVSDPRAVAHAAIQAKISNGIPLTTVDKQNKTSLEGVGYTFTYPMDYTSGGGGESSGLQTVNILTDFGEALGITPPEGTTGVPATLAGGGFAVPWWRGPGGGLQMPWNDPQVAEYLKKFALDDSYLKTYYRAPRGYVIVRDAAGRPYAVLRQIARQFHLWRAAAKPPISATDWKHYKRNQVIEKKLIKIARPALRKHTRPAAVRKGRK